MVWLWRATLLWLVAATDAMVFCGSMSVVSKCDGVPTGLERMGCCVDVLWTGSVPRVCDEMEHGWARVLCRLDEQRVDAAAASSEQVDRAQLGRQRADLVVDAVEEHERRPEPAADSSRIRINVFYQHADERRRARRAADRAHAGTLQCGTVTAHDE